MDYCVEELTKGWFILLNLVLSPQSRERERERERERGCTRRA